MKRLSILFLWLCLTLAIGQAALAQPVTNPTSITQCAGVFKTFTLSGCHHYSSTPALTGIGAIVTTGTVTADVSVNTTYAITGYNADNTVCGTVNQVVTVNPLPSFTLRSVGYQSVDNGVQVNLQCRNKQIAIAASVTTYTYSWSPDLPSTVLSSTTGYSINATFGVSGIHNIPVTATDPATGCQVQKTIPVDIKPVPYLTLVAPTSTRSQITVCLGQPIDIQIKADEGGGFATFYRDGYSNAPTDLISMPVANQIVHISVTPASVGTFTYAADGGDDYTQFTYPDGRQEASKCFSGDPSDTRNHVYFQAIVKACPNPVSFVSFVGQALGGQNLLKWQTSEETQNKGFEIERSPNAKGFERIGFVGGMSDSRDLQTYTFTDSQPLNSTNYYRLKQLDNDGHFAYSRTVAIVSEADNSFLVFYPNPTADEITVKSDLGTVKEAQIMTINGTVLMSKAATTEAMIFSLKNIPSGTYLLNVAIDDYYVTKKIIKQ